MSAPFTFDPATAAWWGNPDKRDFIQTMVELHSQIFGITLEQAREDDCTLTGDKVGLMPLNRFD